MEEEEGKEINVAREHRSMGIACNWDMVASVKLLLYNRILILKLTLRHYSS